MTRTATAAVLALTRFRLAAYARSHRIIQPFIGLLAIMIVLYSTGVPSGQELPTYSDSAAMLVPVFAWAVRGLLDTEPDVQRLISVTATGRPGREVTSGLLAGASVAAGLALLALLVPLAIGFADFPSGEVLAGGAALHLLSLTTGTALGTLTSRPILPDPAMSTLALLGGYVTILLISLAPLTWLTVPVIGWIRAAGKPSFLTAALPALALITLAWCTAALVTYIRLRRTHP
ncbi:hypothetical protein [Sphaerisporangium aureirubrum]|uniref:ABC transporter permease n=1 Tax=Sphaerisporangium aureirubrum TaxID=1544736 RepID=A0ABW1NS51_9ACTN